MTTPPQGPWPGGDDAPTGPPPSPGASSYGTPHEASSGSAAWPPPGQQELSPPFGQNGAPSSRSKLPLLAGAAVVGVLALGLLLVLLLRDGGSSSPPDDVAADYVQAVIDGDCDAVYGLSSADVRKEIGDCKDDTVVKQFEDNAAAAKGVDLGEFTVKDEKDDTATVSVSFTQDGQKGNGDLSLVKEDGNWLVDTSIF